MGHFLEAIVRWFGQLAAVGAARRMIQSILPNFGLLYLIVVIVGVIVAWALLGRLRDRQAKNRVSAPLSERVADSNDKISKEVTTDGTTLMSWREKLDILRADESIVINGLVVWKLQAKDGRVYYAGEREFSSVEEVLSHYKVT